MKDKEKQIEEMANILCESKEHNCNGEDCKCLKQATDLFNKGARIIYKDSVVLSREEFEKLKTQLKIKTNEADWRASQLQVLDKDIEELENKLKQLSKETAEKIICIIKTFSYDKEFTKIITRIIAERFGIELGGE